MRQKEFEVIRRRFLKFVDNLNQFFDDKIG